MSKLEPYQQRVVDEKAALDIKIRSLQNFLGVQAVGREPNIPMIEYNLLRKQLKHMMLYSAALMERIDYFKFNWVDDGHC